MFLVMLGCNDRNTVSAEVPVGFFKQKASSYLTVYVRYLFYVMSVVQSVTV